MCILFLHTNLNPVKGGYRLILAVNRDEAYKRPTLPAHFWMEDQAVIGGRDMEPGKEGGTWLALSKTGRVAALLNVLSMNTVNSVTLLGRGNLVSDFVLSRNTSEQYLSQVATSAHKYNSFNLLAIQISLNGINVSACSNARDESPRVIDLGSGTIGQGNSPIGQPFLKVSEGTKRFEYIVKKFGSKLSKEALEENLITLLRWDQQHFPDPAMLDRGAHLPKERLKELSSVFVKLDLPSYGTRTHTLILVDADNCVDYIEYTMDEPIDPKQPIWKKMEKNFTLTLE